MKTEQFAKKYFKSIHDGGWETYVSEAMTYVVLDTTDVMKGKEFYLKGAGQFYSLSTALETKQLIIQDYQVAALNCYTLKSPSGLEMKLDVGEFLSFNDEGKLLSSSIFFDSNSLNKFMSQNK